MVASYCNIIIHLFNRLFPKVYFSQIWLRWILFFLSITKNKNCYNWVDQSCFMLYLVYRAQTHRPKGLRGFKSWTIWRHLTLSPGLQRIPRIIPAQEASQRRNISIQENGAWRRAPVGPAAEGPDTPEAAAPGCDRQMLNSASRDQRAQTAYFYPDVSEGWMVGSNAVSVASIPVLTSQARAAQMQLWATE